MRGDFSSFWKKEKQRNFNGVLHQQGRVLLDRDWNAQTEIFNDWQETAARDVIGAGVAAVPAEAADGFRVTGAEIAAGTGAVKITVREGRVWADGLLVELTDDDELTNEVVREAHYFGPPPGDRPAPPAIGARDAVVLEAWREELSAFQKPALLIEPALGGVDTTERLRTSFRFRLLRLKAGETCDSVAAALGGEAGKARLTVVLDAPEPTDDDCPTTTTGGYTGFEHQLYRVEIARQTKIPGDCFKWSQFNGGLVGRGTFDAGRKVKIDANLNAVLHSGLTSFYLEALEEKDDFWEVSYAARATLNQSDNTLNLPADANDDFFGAPPTGGSVFFRLWDDVRPVADFAAEKPLKDGINLHFETPGTFAPHDYWTFAVRAGEIGNDTVLLDREPPAGIRYHRVPVAELVWTSATSAVAEDCRRIFPPLTKLKGCCTYSVGDGVGSHGDFTSVQAALEALPPEGGRICVLPGEYVGEIVLDRTTRNRNVTIRGCGERTRLVAGENAAAAIRVSGGRNIAIESLSVTAGGRPAILLEGDEPFAGEPPNEGRGVLQDVRLADLRVRGSRHSAVELRVGQQIAIRRCLFFVEDEDSDWRAAVYLAGDDLLFAENEIRVVTGEQIKLGLTGPPESYKPARAAAGGLHLAGGCERVRVLDNLILGGIGNGITLGSVDEVQGGVIRKHAKRWQAVFGLRPRGACEPNPGVVIVTDAPQGTRLVAGDDLRDVSIERNRIFSMGLNGIGVDAFFTIEPGRTNALLPLPPTIQLINVEQLTIAENRIELCLNRVNTEPSPQGAERHSGYGGIALASVGRLVVRDNFIRHNGANSIEPVCGLFVLFARGAEVSRNHVIGNGWQGEPKLIERLKNGARGGIYFFAAAPGPTRANGVAGAASGLNGAPALKLFDNVVAAPAGRALSVRAAGEVAIDDNDLLTDNATREESPAGRAAGVWILNLSTATASPAGFVAGREGRLSNRLGEIFDRVGVAAGRAAEPLDPALARLRAAMLFRGTVHFAGNRCETVLQSQRTAATVRAAVIIASLDETVFLGNRSRFVVSQGRVPANTLLYGANVRASDNGWRETPERAENSAVTMASGLNTTTDNQSTHCVLVYGRLFLDRFNLTQRDALQFGGDFAAIYANSNIQLPCRQARRPLSGFGRLRETIPADLPNRRSVREF